MKKSLFIIIISIIISIALTSVVVLAHSGRTDAYGGHTNRKTGQYHYHNSGTIKKTTSTYNYKPKKVDYNIYKPKKADPQPTYKNNTPPSLYKKK